MGAKGRSLGYFWYLITKKSKLLDIIARRKGVFWVLST